MFNVIETDGIDLKRNLSVGETNYWMIIKGNILNLRTSLAVINLINQTPHRVNDEHEPISKTLLHEIIQ